MFYYDVPHQVMFLWNKIEHIGIVYQTWVIDLADGSAHTTEEVLQNCRSYGIDADDAIIEWDEWYDLDFV